MDDNIKDSVATSEFSEGSSSSGTNTPDHVAKIQPVNDEVNTEGLEDLEGGKPSPLTLVLTLASCLSGFSFGYDTGYISSALVNIGTDLGRPLTYGNEEYITAATSLGALIACIFAGILADLFGRRPIILGSNFLFLIGAILQCVAHGLWIMIIGRLIMGFGVGIGSLMAPVFISELAPSKFRGRLVILNSFTCTGGQLVAYAIGAGLSSVKNGWRISVGLSMVPPVAQFIAFMFFLPDTPRFLILKGRTEKARQVLRRIYPEASPQQVDCSIRELQNLNCEVPGKNAVRKSWNSIKYLHSNGAAFRALVLACGMQAIQQFTGFNSLMYFSATIFKAVGFENSTAVSIIVAGTNFLFTVVAFFIIDRVGRRCLMLISLTGMVIFLVLAAIAFHFLHIVFHGSDSEILAGEAGKHTWGIVIIVAMILYVASFAIGCGNVPWQQGELFPQSVRAIGSSYACVTNWTGSLVISATFLTMLQNITPTGTFSLFAALSAASLVFIYFFYPELSGLDLEETQQLLTGGFHVKESLEICKLRKQNPEVTRHALLHSARTYDEKEKAVGEHIDIV